MTLQRQLPLGVKDWSAQDLARRQSVEGALMACFEGYGYSRLETPVLEYYDSFSEGFAARDIVKTFDAEGNILALRPDCTIPIARVAVSRLLGEPMPLRLCCAQKVFSGSGPRREYYQADVELLGLESAAGDVEVITLAIQALLRAGLTDFQIEVGQVGFFKALMREAGLTGQDAEQIRQYVEEKNMLGISLMLKDRSESLSQKLMQLPALFGGQEVLKKARSLCAGPDSLAALEQLDQIVGQLKALGLERYISVDLGMVHRIHYYTGVIFKGITSHLGQPLLLGGRYDAMLSGHGLAATGFGINLEQLLQALDKQDGATQANQPVWLIGYESGLLTFAFQCAEKRRAEGYIVMLCHDKDLNELRQEASARGVSGYEYMQNGSEGPEKTEVRL